MYLWKHFRVLSQRQLASPFLSVGSRSVSWLIPGNLMKCCEFPLWWSMSRADFFSDYANQTTSQSPAHLILLLETAWYISYYHRFLHCHPGLLLVMAIMFILPDGRILPSGLYQSMILIPIDTTEPGSLPSSLTVNKSQKRDNPYQTSQIYLYSSFPSTPY